MANARRTRDQWRRLVGEWKGSGLSAEAFAAGAKRRVNPRTLRWWASQLGRYESPVERESKPAFLPVRLATPGAKGDDEVSVGPVEVVLVNGVRLRFEHELDRAGLRALAVAFGGPA